MGCSSSVSVMHDEVEHTGITRVIYTDRASPFSRVAKHFLVPIAVATLVQWHGNTRRTALDKSSSSIPLHSRTGHGQGRTLRWLPPSHVDPGGHSTLQFHAHQRRRCFWNSRPTCKYPQQACEAAACMQPVQHRRLVPVGRIRARGGFSCPKVRTERQACWSVSQSTC